MDAHPSSSDYASNSTDEKYPSNDGESSSSMKLLDKLLNDKRNGKGIISFAGRFDEVTRRKVVSPKILEAESFHMVGINNRSLSDRHNVVEIDGKRATDLLCGCCYWEFPAEEIVHCTNGHLCCFKCLRRRVDEIIYGGLKAHCFLSCINMGGCKESIPLLEIGRVLRNDVFEKYEYRQAQEAIVEAKVEGLVYCPFCNIPYEVDKCVQVLECPNTKCLKASCIQCKKLNHFPLLCEEVQKTLGILRGQVEERMTKAVIRECNICHAKLIKMEGTCNKVICKCGNTMCYVCRRTIPVGYYHFCNCANGDGRAEQGKPCRICNKCNLMDELAEANEAMNAKEEALKEYAGKEPKLLDLQIGPPLKMKRLPLDFKFEFEDFDIQLS